MMTEKEKELFAAYRVNHQYWIEDEIDELQTRVRFRRIRTEDLVELLLARQRLDDFREFTADIAALLGL